MRASIGALFPSAACMKAESVYVIEDTHTMMMCSKEGSDEGPIFCKHCKQPSLEKKKEVEGGPKKKGPTALGARRRAEEATELCLALCGCLAR